MSTTTQASGVGNLTRAVANDVEPRHLSLTVNGRISTVMVEPRTTLLEALRVELGLTGTKRGPNTQK
jgi:xanthine dehydrogenase YagT iron-sulfur-binding subunit